MKKKTFELEDGYLHERKQQFTYEKIRPRWRRSIRDYFVNLTLSWRSRVDVSWAFTDLLRCHMVILRLVIQCRVDDQCSQPTCALTQTTVHIREDKATVTPVYKRLVLNVMIMCAASGMLTYRGGLWRDSCWMWRSYAQSMTCRRIAGVYGHVTMSHFQLSYPRRRVRRPVQLTCACGRYCSRCLKHVI